MAFRGGRSATPVEVRRRFWQAIRAGESTQDAAEAVGVSAATGKRWFRDAGGVSGHRADPVGEHRLSMEERETIAYWRAREATAARIGRILGRATSTVCRELAREGATSGHGYSPSAAQADADRLAKRPKPRKVETNPALRAQVQDRLALNHSPQQISRRLVQDFPDDEQMRISHEAIYQSLYVQGQGALKRELVMHLRTGRAVRKPRRTGTERRGRIPGMVNISARAPQVTDRAVPGHWEGDLILGSVASGSAIGTLVEHTTRFVMLLHLPTDHGAVAVQ